MARKRASMREGPLAELFRATEAAQRQAETQAPSRPSEPAARARPEPEPPQRARAAARGRARRARPAAARPEPRSEPRPRRFRPAERPRGAPGSTRCPSSRRGCGSAPRADSAYLAVIRVVGVGGAGLNAIDRMIDAGHHGRRVRRRQHRHPAAADERRAAEDPHRARADGGSRLGCRPGDRARRRRGGVRPDQARAAGLGHGVRRRGRGRGHRLGCGAGRRQDRAGARRPRRRHRHDALPVRGDAPQVGGRGGGRFAPRAPATR